MSAVTQTPGERACRYAVGAESVFENYAKQQHTDLAWGFHTLAGEAAYALSVAVKKNSVDDMEEISCRYAQLNAIIFTIAQQADHDLLFAGEALLEVAKLMLDEEISRLMRQAVKS